MAEHPEQAARQRAKFVCASPLFIEHLLLKRGASSTRLTVSISSDERRVKPILPCSPFSPCGLVSTAMPPPRSSAIRKSFMPSGPVKNRFAPRSRSPSYMTVLHAYLPDEPDAERFARGRRRFRCRFAYRTGPAAPVSADLESAHHTPPCSMKKSTCECSLSLARRGRQ